jgi:putative ABC transport system ATP-binding protein
MVLLEAKDVQKKYLRAGKEFPVLFGVDLKIQEGDFIAIMGPSGSGKSTFLQMLGGLDQPSQGQILLQGTDLARCKDRELSLIRRRKLGFIFQFFHLLPTLNAIENVMLPKQMDGISSAKIRQDATELLDYMGLKDRINHFPEELSGGEMQRVAIARALLSKPAVILADEPTGNLDSVSGQKVLELLRQIVADKKATIVMVTHDPKAASYANRLVKVKDGRIESDTKQ